MTEKHPSADEIFSAAVQRAEGSDRSAYLDANCGDDPQLRQRVDRLLRASADAGSFLEQPAEGSVATLDIPPPSEQPGSVIGPYKLLEQIGEGGMGVWFLWPSRPSRSGARSP